VIKLVSDLRQVGGLLRVLPVSSNNTTDCHDITEILLKVALSIIKPNQTTKFMFTDNAHTAYKGCNAMYGKKPVKFTHKTYIRTLG
jgi:hypothetical protein